MKIGSTFKLVFLSVLSLTFVSLIGIFSLVIIGSKETDPQKIPVLQTNFYNACNFGWQAGLGAILGLLGGKTSDLIDEQEEDEKD